MEALEGRALFSAAPTPVIPLTAVDTHPAVPAYSSRPGAAYTVYLDFAGFNFNGDWNNQGNPGTTAAYDTDGDTTTFSAQDNAAIGKVWATIAGKYAGLSINVTTVDPAVAAGKAASDAQRQAYYDNTMGVLHTVIGGNGGWDGGSGLGVSQLDVARNSYASPSANNGPHTNWIYAGLVNGDTYYSAGGPTHENGHAFGLFHQSDITPGAEEEYDPGEPASAVTASYSPIMGGQDGQTRNLWRNGTVSDGTFQNDIATFLRNPNMTLTDDGIGHSLQTATALGLNGSNVNSSQAKGYINTASDDSPVALGVGSYTTDYFKFNTKGAAINLVLHAGADRDGDGQTDPGATFDGSFNILDASGNVVGSSVRDASSLFYTFNGTLGAGSYYAQVLDFGGYASPREAGVGYFTSGDYFFTGSGFSSTVITPTTKSPFLLISNPRVKEGNSGLTAMTFTVTLSQPSTQKITVSWKTKAGSAKAGTDYMADSGKLTFKPGQTSMTITVFVKTDLIKESNETFTLQLFNPKNARFGDSGGTGTIVNDDK